MPFLLIAYPFLEFWSVLELSARVGALATLMYIVAMIVVGYWLLQWAGRSALLTAGRFPSAAALRGQLFAGEISVAFGAVLLMLPGIISDVLAFYVFARAALKALLSAVTGSGAQRRASEPGHSTVDNDDRDIPHRSAPGSDHDGPVTLEGDFSRVKED